ncbi:hypothetical protein ACOSQ4_031329 [Xanthoceras sorbifolium]
MSPQPKKVLTGKGAYVFSVKEGARGFSAMSSSLSDKLSSLLDTSHQLKKCVSVISTLDRLILFFGEWACPRKAQLIWSVEVVGQSSQYGKYGRHRGWQYSRPKWSTEEVKEFARGVLSKRRCSRVLSLKRFSRDSQPMKVFAGSQPKKVLTGS